MDFIWVCGMIYFIHKGWGFWKAIFWPIVIAKKIMKLPEK